MIARILRVTGLICCASGLAGAQTFSEQGATVLGGYNGSAISGSFGDIDNDGDPDLLIQGTTSSRKLFRNNTIGTGSATFTDITLSGGIIANDTTGWSAAWGDYDGDGNVDVFLGEANTGTGIAGDLFRNNLRHQTRLGRLARTYMDRGELVPDDITEGMVRERLEQPDASGGFVLDGFPRTLPQAEGLTEMLTGAGRRLAAVIHLHVPDELIVERLAGRLVCRECQRPFHRTERPFEVCPEKRCEGQHLYRRDDDAPETVRARLRTYHAETAPLVDYYRSLELLREVDGVGGIEVVLGRVRDAVGALTRG